MKIIVNSHFGHEQCWQPWLAFWKMAWPGSSWETVLVSNRCYEHPARFDTHWSLDADLNWCVNLLSYLQHIDDEYVFLTIEDFWFHEPVALDLLDEATKVVRSEHPACLCLSPCPGPTQPTNGHFIGERLPGTDYRICAGPSFWNREYLMELLRRTSASCREPATAWDFEITGTAVSNAMNGKVLASNVDVMPFLHSALRRGKWHPPTLEVARQRGIYVNTEGHEFLKDGEY